MKSSIGSNRATAIRSLDEIAILEVLTDHGLITPEKKQEVVDLYNETGKPPGHILVRKRILQEKHLYKFICKDLGMNPTRPYSTRSYTIAGLTVPKFRTSGDFYGIFPMSDGRIALTLSDVSGKGLEAGILAILLGNLLREGIRMQNIVPNAIMKKINLASRSFFGEDQFATFVVMLLDLYSGTVEYCAAGSPPILVYRHKEGIIEELDQRNIPVGIYEDFQFKGNSLNLDKGDMLLAYTDGAFESRGLRGDMYGVHRLKNAFLRLKDKKLSRLLSGLKSDMRRFSLLRGLADDTTYLSIVRHRKR
ncbi:MAG: PP2C family protein-serine/threonine phosphatase [Leptospiraceae bacterium]